MRIKNRTVIIASIICVLSLIAMLTVIAITRNEPESAGFTPPEFDSAAVLGSPDVPENMGYTPIEVEVGYKAFVCGELKAVNGSVDVYFTSAAENAVWMKLKLLDESGKTLGETGVIKPGEYVKAIKLDSIPGSTAAVKLKIIAYQPDTWYSMGTVSLNTKLNVQ